MIISTSLKLRKSIRNVEAIRNQLTHAHAPSFGQGLCAPIPLSPTPSPKILQLGQRGRIQMVRGCIRMRVVRQLQDILPGPSKSQSLSRRHAAQQVLRLVHITIVKEASRAIDSVLTRLHMWRSSIIDMIPRSWYSYRYQT